MMNCAFKDMFANTNKLCNYIFGNTDKLYNYIYILKLYNYGYIYEHYATFVDTYDLWKLHC